MNDDFRINWSMPLPIIGDKVEAPLQPQTLDPIKLFETGSFEMLIKPEPASPLPKLPEAVAAGIKKFEPMTHEFPKVRPALAQVYEVFAKNINRDKDRYFCLWNGECFFQYVTNRHAQGIKGAVESAALKTEPTKLVVTAWRLVPELLPS